MTQKILPKDLARRLQAGEALQIIDVRSPDEFAHGHIPGARNVPLPTIGSAIPGVDSNRPLVLVCQGGMRSTAACQRVHKSHGAILDLVGGTMGWLQEGLEVE